MGKVAIYPGTFDPITNGHVDIITRGLDIFDRVVLGVATSTRKTPAFSLSQRLAMCAQTFSSEASVTVLPLEGLLVEFAKTHQAQFILRGVRGVTDFDYELQMHGMNHTLDASIDTLFLPALPEHQAISATMIREIISLGGNISDFVPSAVIKETNT